MLVRDVMTAQPVTISADAPVRTAIDRLAGNGVTALPVVDDAARIVGVVSEADLILGRVQPDPIASEQRAHSTSRAGEVIGDVMSRPTFVRPETDLHEACRILVATGDKSLPVVDAAHHVVGVVSRSDIVRVLARDDDELQEAIAAALARAGEGGYRAEVRNAVVRLQAVVSRDPGEKERVRDIVATIPGVAEVQVR